MVKKSVTKRFSVFDRYKLCAAISVVRSSQRNCPVNYFYGFGFQNLLDLGDPLFSVPSVAPGTSAATRKR